MGAAHAQKRDQFDKVLAIQGRGRRYFATTEEIAGSGQSTQPKPIPRSPYWVMTNSQTPQKRAMLRDVLTLLGYSEAAISAAAAAIA